MDKVTHRGQLIEYQASQTPGTNYWVGYAHVQLFESGGSVRFVPFTGTVNKHTKKEDAETEIILVTRKYIDDQLGPAQP